MIDLINRSINELELSIRVHDAFRKYEPDMRTIGDLVKKSEGELLRLPNFGRKSLNEVREMLAGMNLNLGMEEHQIPKTMDKIQQDFVYNIIEHASDAASKSLDIILQKKEWAYNDIEKHFNAHQTIMETYKLSLQKLHD